MRIVGLPLCLWHRDFFRQVGDACGGYLGVDEETMGNRNLQWARVLIKTNGRNMPGKLQVVLGGGILLCLISLDGRAICLS